MCAKMSLKTAVLISFVVCILAIQRVCCQSGNSAFWIFWGDSLANNRSYAAADANALLTDPNFDPNKLTTVYIHGWKEQMADESIQTVVSAYLQNGGHNIIAFDWSESADTLYTAAVGHVRRIGASLGQIFVNLFEAGLSIEKFHLVGHSLGAQMAGYAGRNVISFSNERFILERISGLDPAGPLWYIPNINVPISRRDAKMVDILHTDSQSLGAPRATGSIDFWPNSGSGPQPGCPRISLPTELCSHHRSWRFWSESLTTGSPQSTFSSVRANNWRAFTRGNVDDSIIITMGINTPSGLTGDWYLQTNGESLFSRDQHGIHYS